MALWMEKELWLSTTETSTLASSKILLWLGKVSYINYKSCYKLADGIKITGVFEDGIVNSHAKKEYEDGRVYVGQFRHDVEILRMERVF